MLAASLSGCSVLHADPAPGPTGTPMQAFDRSGTQHASFSSPTGNIACAFDAAPKTGASARVRCEIIVRSWKPPPQPATCTVDWGKGLSLDRVAGVLCANDTVRELQAQLTLPYGSSIRFAPFTCASLKSGIDCVNTDDGAGFLIGQQRYQLRNP